MFGSWSEATGPSTDPTPALCVCAGLPPPSTTNFKVLLRLGFKFGVRIGLSFRVWVRGSVGLGRVRRMVMDVNTNIVKVVKMGKHALGITSLHTHF